MPSPCSTNSTSGNAAPPWETRYAGPVSGLFSTGVWIVALPITEPSSHAAGLALNTASGHAFWSVVRREGSATGSCRSTFAMFACPSPAEVDLHVQARPVRLCSPGPLWRPSASA